jgi:Methylamine utilization protein MauJ
MIFSRSLEQILRSLLIQSEFSFPFIEEMEERFHAMRATGLLPKGRARRAEAITHAHLTHAVLGLTPTSAAHAGFAAKILGNLVPAGGAAKAFETVPNLHACILALIESEQARGQLVRLTLSMGEGGTNSHGYAELLYEHPEHGLLRTYFVGSCAVSRTAEDGDSFIPTGYRYAPASRELTLNAHFFADLRREIDFHNALDAPPGDGSEYDAIEAREAEYARLGAKRHSRFLNIGVDASVTWPMKGTIAQLGEHKLVLLPRTAEHSASIHIDLFHHNLSIENGRTVIHRFLSQLAWQDDHYAIAQDGWAGNPIPVAVPRRELAAMVSPHWWFDEITLTHPDAERALALYREGRNAQYSYLVSYAVLSFYKIIEIAKGKQKGAARDWIKAAYLQVREERQKDESFDRFETLVADWNAPNPKAKSPQEYLWQACRVAVAHGSEKSVSDPDALTEVRRLHTVADVMRWIARKAIQDELGVASRF